jgi:DNA polymerase-3 subunit delta
MPRDGFHQQLKGAPLRSLYYLYGEEAYKVEEAVKLINQKLFGENFGDTEKDGLSFNRDLFDAQQVEPEKIQSAVRTFPFMAERRLVLLKNVDKAKTPLLESLLPLIEDPVETTTFVMTGQGMDARKKFFKALKKQKAVFEFKKIYENELSDWICDFLEEEEKTAEPDVIQFLMEMVGTDLGNLRNEITKLCLYVEPRDEIRLEDVEKSLVRTKLSTIFQFLDALGRKDRAETVGRAEEMLRQSEEPLFMLSMVARQLKQLWLAAGLMAEGRSEKEVGSSLGLHPRFRSVLLRQAKNFKDKDFGRLFEICNQCDRDLKSSPLKGDSIFMSALIQMSE